MLVSEISNATNVTSMYFIQVSFSDDVSEKAENEPEKSKKKKKKADIESKEIEYTV